MELFACQPQLLPSQPRNRATSEQTSARDHSVKNVLTAKDASASCSFSSLGLCDWLCTTVRTMGYRQPTPIQVECIPAVLKGLDVIACAETGSGKTAAFALPLLHLLSMDPYGVFALILTPTRELAIQIAEQLGAFGASLNVSVALAIGGLDLIAQGLQLSRRPHFIVATPGRLRHHLSSADPPNLSKCRFLVLDEADRLLSLGFSEELEGILPHLSTKRNTLLFSATFSSSMEEVERMAMQDAVRFDLTKERKIPLTVNQKYLFVPAKIKLCFLVVLLKKITGAPVNNAPAEKAGKKRKTAPQEAAEVAGSQTAPALTIVFVQSCHRCHEISLLLKAMEVECVALHSMLSQAQRLQSLRSFKSMATKVLVATDVASRGLDIPQVDHVVNFDLPRAPEDYVHRVGRTARIGRDGSAISFVTQHDIALLQSIEGAIGTQLQKYDDISEESVLPVLNPLSKALQTVQQSIMSSGILEKEALFKKRKRQQKRKLLRKLDSADKTLSAISNS